MRDTSRRLTFATLSAGGALSAGEGFRDGFARALDGSILAVSAAEGSALDSAHRFRGGFIRDAQGRLVVVLGNGAPLGGQAFRGGFLRDTHGRLVVVSVTPGSSLDAQHRARSGYVRDPAGRLVVAIPDGGAPASWAATVAADSPVGWWRLGEASGTAAADSAGANPGTFSGGVALGATGARPGNTAATFDGTTGALTIPDAPVLDVADVFTWEMFFKRSATQGVLQTLVNRGSTAFSLKINVDGTIKLRKEAVADIAATTVAVTDQAWHHLVCTKNGAAVKLYLDGVDVTGPVVDAPLVATATPLIIANAFPGSVDECLLYAAALTPARVSAHFAATAA